MEFLWRYIGDLVGKGLEWYTIFEFIFYSIPYLIPNALPLAVLLSTIMTFGNLGERFELVALKSSGASLLRIMRPLLGVMVIIAGLAFYASNILIPRANLSWGALFYDVTHKKPAMNIQDGIFYNELDGFSIRVGKKGDDNKSIYDVLIYTSAPSGGIDVIMAESGTMEFTPDERFLVMTLKNGKRYQEMVDNPSYQRTFPHNTMGFESYSMSMDLGELQLQRSDPELFKDNYNMLNLKELVVRIDSMGGLIADKQMFLRNYLSAYYHIPDSSARDTFHYSAEQLKEPFADQLGRFIHLNDSQDNKGDSLQASELLHGAGSILRDGMIRMNNLPVGTQANTPYTRTELVEDAKQTVRNLTRIVNSTADDMRKLKQRQVRYTIEWHKKFSLALSCILLFFIGAPLGAIIKKGGFGTPMVVALLLFIGYFILQTVGEKLAREMVIEVWNGVWLSTIVLIPMAVFLTYKANRDSKLFDSDYYKGLIRWFGAIFPGRKSKTAP